MAHKNYSQLQKAIMKKAMNNIGDGLLDSVKDKMIPAIKETVYDVYSPIRYNRRMNNGGLGDRKNIVGTIENEKVNGFKYRIKNIALPFGNDAPQVYLAPLIVMGQMRALSQYPLTYYDGAENYEYGKPRDFITATKLKMRDSVLAVHLEKDMNGW